MNDALRTSPRVILVVEDDPALNDALRQCLVDEGYDAAGAATLEAARKAMRSTAVDAALLDLHLHLLGETTESLLDELALDERSPLAVLMSADPSAPAVARRFGIPLLRKPFDLDALFHAIGRARRPIDARDLAACAQRPTPARSEVGSNRALKRSG